MNGATILKYVGHSAWDAWYRALWAERADACFRDPLAKRLAGSQRERIAQGMAFDHRNALSCGARTVLVGALIADVAVGCGKEKGGVL